MGKNYFNKKKATAAEATPVRTEAPAPVLELGEVKSITEETEAPKTIGTLESLTKETTTPEFAELNRYKVTARGGLVLRETPPPDTNASSGMYAGAGILCIPYENSFVEIKRENNWSYGNYNGKSGWVCNLYLAKEE